MENLWTKENFEKITKIFEEKGIENWQKICFEYKIKKGDPGWSVKNAYYSNKAVADNYDFEDHPRYDEVKNVIVVRNPFSAARQVVNNLFASPEFPIFGRYIEMDAEIARKILVLGLP